MSAALVPRLVWAQDVPDEAIVKIREFLKMLPKRLKEYEDLLSGQPIWLERTKDVAETAMPGDADRDGR